MNNELPLESHALLNKLRLRQELKNYLLNKEAPKCNFLRSVLVNDLFNTLRNCTKADLKELDGYYKFLYLYAPAEAYGSKKNVGSWLGLSYDFWTINLLSVLCEKLDITSNDCGDLYYSNIFLVHRSKNEKRTPKATANLIINANPEYQR